MTADEVQQAVLDFLLRTPCTYCPHPNWQSLHARLDLARRGDVDTAREGLTVNWLPDWLAEEADAHLDHGILFLELLRLVRLPIEGIPSTLYRGQGSEDPVGPYWTSDRAIAARIANQHFSPVLLSATISPSAILLRNYTDFASGTVYTTPVRATVMEVIVDPRDLGPVLRTMLPPTSPPHIADRLAVRRAQRFSFGVARRKREERLKSWYVNRQAEVPRSGSYGLVDRPNVADPR